MLDPNHQLQILTLNELWGTKIIGTEPGLQIVDEKRRAQWANIPGYKYGKPLLRDRLRKETKNYNKTVIVPE